MKKENFKKAIKINLEIEKIDRIYLPDNISDVDSDCEDWIANRWDGYINVEKKYRFEITGGTDDYGRYYISIGELHLTAKESNRLVDAISAILSDRKEKLEAKFKEL